MGRIFDIQKFSVNDGPGIRTLIFFQGCPLRCRWCSNPESQRPYSQLMFFSDLCKSCKKCVDVCPNQCISFDGGTRHFNKSLCDGCGQCADICPENALRIAGKNVSEDEIVAVAEQDFLFYFNSGGGVTIGGGEPMMQPRFLSSTLSKLKKRGMDTAIETCGYADWQSFEEVIPNLDLVIFDVKHMDPEIHREFTGKSNGIILNNLSQLLQSDLPLIVRIPVIPGFNDNRKSIQSIKAFLEKNNTKNRIQRLELLPYHKLGINKYKSLGIDYALKEIETPPPDTISVLLDIFSKCSFEAKVEYL